MTDQTNDNNTATPPSGTTSQQATTPSDQNQDLTMLQQELENSQKQLEATKEQLQNLTAVSQRALADLQNYKRRTEEEKASFVTFANAELLTALLPAIDNIHRALAHDPKDAEWAKGAEQTMKQLTDTLEKLGLKPIPTLSQKFDPNIHEALMTAPGEKDLILAELEKGYTWNDKTIKRARVTVGNGETPKPSESTPA